MYRERCIVSLQSYNDKNIPKAMPWGYFARFTKRLVELRPVLTGGGLGVVVVIGGLDDVIISPTPSPRKPSAALHNGRKMPMEGFGVFQVRDKEECKRSVLEAIKAGYPVFEHRNLAKICETTVLACCIPAFLDKLKNPAYTYNVGRAFWKGRCPFTGSSHLFQEQEVSPDSPSLIKAKLILPAQFLHQVHGESLATAWMFHEP